METASEYLCRSDGFTILAGTNSLNESGVKQDVIQIVIHESFKGLKNDVALVRLREDLTFSNSVSAIKLLQEEIPYGANVTISGWGKTSNVTPHSNKLKYNTLRRLSWKDCVASTGMPFKGLICLGHKIDNGACFVGVANSTRIFCKTL